MKIIKQTVITLVLLLSIFMTTGCINKKDEIYEEPHMAITDTYSPTDTPLPEKPQSTITQPVTDYEIAKQKFDMAYKTGIYETEKYKIDCKMLFYDKYIWEEVVNNIFVLNEIPLENAQMFATDVYILINECCDFNDELSEQILSEYLDDLIHHEELSKKELETIFNNVTDEMIQERYNTVRVFFDTMTVTPKIIPTSLN